MPEVFAHIVTWNSSETVLKTIAALLGQKGFDNGGLTVLITDNASTNGVFEKAREVFNGRAEFVKNEVNLGFCGGHNFGASRFLNSDSDFFFILNPDVVLEEDALIRMVEALKSSPEAGSACPRLYRADSDLNPVTPPLIDAAGMYLTQSLRHFDRGSNLPDCEEYDVNSFVFGGSGAALLMNKKFVESMILDCGEREKDLFKVYPQLEKGFAGRRQLFDEGFFAYREDADLAWRAQTAGWKCLYVAGAKGFHTRVVIPEKRKVLAPELNSLGVKNRFLLQVNNYHPLKAPKTILPGFIIRNLLVLAGVFLLERTSLAGLRDAIRLFPRAWARRLASARRPALKQA